mmetsp:Transcript_26386/g.51992  ORF Transcript_26386/g.51992 Transcript_26386/m.51992 type:complete len:199 (+) Transcript_26386:423-1019(+)
MRTARPTRVDTSGIVSTSTSALTLLLFERDRGALSSLSALFDPLDESLKDEISSSLQALSESSPTPLMSGVASGGGGRGTGIGAAGFGPQGWVAWLGTSNIKELASPNQDAEAAADVEDDENEGSDVDVVEFAEEEDAADDNAEEDADAADADAANAADAADAVDDDEDNDADDDEDDDGVVVSVVPLAAGPQIVSLK